MAKRRKILSVVGTRPNMMKIAPIAAELARRADEFEHVLVHTGQHYDREMSEIFLEELGVGEPDYSLGVGSGSHAQQTAAVMERLEPVLLEAEPDIVLVPGDVNSTMAAALTASKLLIPIGHVEAGLRSFDRTMPEEINRIVADQLSELLFIHSPEARDNLLAEGCPAPGIHDVGNTMIDTLVAMRDRIEERAPRRRRTASRAASTSWSRCTVLLSWTGRCWPRRWDSWPRSRPSCRSSSRFIRGRAPRSRPWRSTSISSGCASSSRLATSSS